MKLDASRCPSPVELERAYWTRDDGARAHADGCARCGAEWSEIAALVHAGRAIDAAPAGRERHEEIRTALLARQSRPTGAGSPARRARWVVGAGAVAAAAAAALLWWGLRARDGGDRGDEGERVAAPATAPAVRRASVLDHDGARYLHATAQPDEIVRLVDGALTVEVEPLRRGERFRVVTGDAEVVVVGTAFDVRAEGDALRLVRVIHGTVEVRLAAGPIQVLTAGQSWRAAPVEEPPVAPPPPSATPPAGAHIQSSRDAGPPRPSPRSAAQQAFDDGWQAIRAGEFDRAASAFERAMAADAARTRLAEDAHYWRSVALARAGHAERAAAVFEAFVATYPSSRRAGEASVMLGWILFERGEFTMASRRFRAAITDPSDRVRQSATQGLEALRRAGH